MTDYPKEVKQIYYKRELLYRIFGKADAGRAAINTDDLVQPSRKTRYSDPDLSYTTLAACTDIYKYSFFQEQHMLGTH